MRYVVIIGMPVLIACPESPLPVNGSATPAFMNTPIPNPESPLREASFDAATGMAEPASFSDSGITMTIRRIEWAPQSGLWLDMAERRCAELVQKQRPGAPVRIAA